MTHPGDRVSQSSRHSDHGRRVRCDLSLHDRCTRAARACCSSCRLRARSSRCLALGEIETASPRSMASIAGPLYIGALLTTVALIRRDQGEDGPRWVLMALMFAWLADTGGYFVGRAFGRHKLYEARQPEEDARGIFRLDSRGVCRRATCALLVPAENPATGRAAARRRRRCARSARRFVRILDQAFDWNQRLGLGRARARRHSRSHRCAARRESRRLPLRSLGRSLAGVFQRTIPSCPAAAAQKVPLTRRVVEK